LVSARTATSDEESIRILIDLLERPDAERPYLELARRYRELGMEPEAEAVVFLVEERFGDQIADGSDSGEGRREDDSQDA
jgi:hypothetical protein